MKQTLKESIYLNMLYKSLIILCFLSGLAYGSDDTFFYYDLNQSTNDKTYNYDLNTLNEIKKEKKDPVVKFNEKNYMNFMLGMDQEEFEEKDSFYKRTLNPSFSFDFNHKITTWLMGRYYFRTTTNNFIATQNIILTILKLGSFEVNPLVQIGEKVALKEQKNSGYFFINTGVNLKMKVKKITLSLDYLKNYSDFKFDSTTFRGMYDIENDKKLGIYFGIENYIPLDYSYDREGQRSVRGGFLYMY